MLQEHYYDADGGSGYLAWRIKTVQRNTAVQSRRCYPSTTYQDGPKSKRDFLLTCEQLTGEECREAISFIKHSADESVVKEKMKATFQCRMTRDQQASSTVLDVFPRHPWLGKNNMSYFVYYLDGLRGCHDSWCFSCRLTKISQ